MPLTQASLLCSLSWRLQEREEPFAPRVQKDSNQFSLRHLDLTVYDQLYAADFELVSGTGAIVDLYDFTNLAGGAVIFTKVLAIMVTVVGGSVRISPGPTLPLSWFFSPAVGTVANEGIILKDGGYGGSIALVSGPYPVSATERHLLFEELAGSETAPTTVNVEVLGSTH